MFEENEESDFGKSSWGKILIKNLQEEIIDGVNSLKLVRNKLEKYVFQFHLKYSLDFDENSFLLL